MKKSLNRQAFLASVRARNIYKDWEFYNLPEDATDYEVFVSIVAEVARECGVSLRRAKWAVQKYI